MSLLHRNTAQGSFLCSHLVKELNIQRKIFATRSVVRNL